MIFLPGRLLRFKSHVPEHSWPSLLVFSVFKSWIYLLEGKKEETSAALFCKMSTRFDFCVCFTEKGFAFLSYWGRTRLTSCLDSWSSTSVWHPGLRWKSLKFCHNWSIDVSVHWDAVMLKQEGPIRKLFPQSWKHIIIGSLWIL